ncbi:MAG TPA: leucyl/phenylalanyl-tRNA--protein transferase [bacterium]|nr:leucyl/phenylalanyl-tRNA--protein transferase [bacterium]
MPLFQLDPYDTHFPDPREALTEPNGLLAVGGDLSPVRLLRAYRRGIFPWFSPGDPILWWSPDPRTVLFPDEIIIHRSLRKTLKNHPFEIHVNRDFSAVLNACAAPRANQNGTWITSEMQNAYLRLHSMGYAYSIESWRDNVLVGGLYGVKIGHMFFGESMFTRVSDASKAALVALCQGALGSVPAVIDCQFSTEHLLSLGAKSIPRKDFLTLLARYT